MRTETEEEGQEYPCIVCLRSDVVAQGQLDLTPNSMPAECSECGTGIFVGAENRDRIMREYGGVALFCSECAETKIKSDDELMPPSDAQIAEIAETVGITEAEARAFVSDALRRMKTDRDYLRRRNRELRSKFN